MNIAIVLSGGSGKRFKNEKLPKQFEILKGKPLFIHSLMTYLKITEINKIILTVNTNYKELYLKILKKYNLTEKLDLVNGGITRAESIKHALSLIENEEGVVILQNAASPYTKTELIKKCIKEANKHGASQAYIDIEQTIFKKKSDYFKKLINKDNYGFTADPTVYKTGILKKAFLEAEKKIKKNETTLNIINEMNIPIKLVKSDISNLKITLPLDFILAKNINNEF